MGCGGSKVDDLPLVSLCRERKLLIKAAADRRFEFASAHVSYFQTLGNVGRALHRFVEEELSVIPSPPSSPVLSLPPSKKNTSSSSTSLSHSLSRNSPPHDHDNSSHLHFHDSDDEESEDEDSENRVTSSPNVPSPVATNFYSYYMRSSTGIPSIVYEDQPPPQEAHSVYSNYPIGDGFYGVSMGSPASGGYYGVTRNAERSENVPPPPPEVSAWDFLNPFAGFDNGYPEYGYSRGVYRIGSTASSDSDKVREREGIPDLEDETEQENLKEARVGKKVEGDLSGEGTSKATPMENHIDTHLHLEKGSDRTSLTSESKNVAEDVEGGSKRGIGEEGGEEEAARNKEVSFGVEKEVEERIESSRPGNVATSSQRTRDIREVVKEIKEQFQIASEIGKEVSVMLESNKLRYRPKNSILKVISCRILDAVSPPALTSSRPWAGRPQATSARARRMAMASHGDSESGSLSSTLEKLYAWEKKLYKEVKDEERMRVIYEKQCKRLRNLDDRGAESNKIDATQASIRKLLTKISITIKAIDAIARRIHKLRDEELQPQLTELVHGLITMWKNMAKCHQKQFQAIVESKTSNLIGKTGIRRDSTMRATMELELELRRWCTSFNNWISSQKAYVEALNGWLLNWLLKEPEETPDGFVPFSPSRVGAPPVFIICNDWYHALDRISEIEVLRAMHTFAESVHNLWERQDEEQRQKLKAEYLSRDFERKLRSLRNEERKIQGNLDGLEKTAVSLFNKDTGSPLEDDRKAALDSMRKRLEEERAKHRETIKQVHEATSVSLEMGLVPIFEAIENFTCQTLKAHEEVRIQSVGGT